MNNLLVSFKKNRMGILFVIISAIGTSWGQYFWKISNGDNLLWIICGFMLYGIGAVLMIIAFKFGSLSVLHPMLAMGYIFALLIGKFLLNEQVGANKIIGVCLILIGVLCLGVGDE